MSYETGIGLTPTTQTLPTTSTSSGVFSTGPAPSAGGSLATPAQTSASLTVSGQTSTQQPKLTGPLTSQSGAAFASASAVGAEQQNTLIAAQRAVETLKLSVAALNKRVELLKRSLDAARGAEARKQSAYDAAAQALRDANGAERAARQTISAWTDKKENRGKVVPEAYQKPLRAAQKAIRSAQDALDHAARPLTMAKARTASVFNNLATAQRALNVEQKKLDDARMALESYRSKASSAALADAAEDPVTKKLAAEAAKVEETPLPPPTPEEEEDLRANGPPLGLVAAAAVVGGFVLWKVLKG